jgi:hypothetical protein
MRFEEILLQAKQGDKKKIEEILRVFQPMLIRHSLVNGRFDEDLYHELVIETLRCIHYFNISYPSGHPSMQAPDMAGVLSSNKL